MKKLFLLSMISLVGCAMPIIPFMAPSETIRSEQCLDSNKLKVFQALDNGVLAHLCPVAYPSYYDDAFDACFVKGDFVFLSVKGKNNDLVDDQRIILPEGQCFVSDGVYKYTTRQKIDKTIRKIKIIDSQIENPAYTQYKKEQVKWEKDKK